MPKKLKPGELVTTPTTPSPIGAAEYSKGIYVDPGDRYIGVAIYERDDLTDEWECVDAFTIDVQAEPDTLEKFEDFLAATTSRGEWDIIGYEVWRLYEDKAQEQKGSEFLATQLIGVIKHIARRNQFMNRWPRQPIELVRFLPDHKKATAGIMKSRGIKSEAKRRKTYGDHAWDAEVQGFRDLVLNRGYTVRTRVL